MFGPLRRVKFLITAPFIVLLCFVINVTTSPGHWWVQWVAFGMGIAWVINLVKLLRHVIGWAGWPPSALTCSTVTARARRAGGSKDPPLRHSHRPATLRSMVNNKSTATVL